MKNSILTTLAIVGIALVCTILVNAYHSNGNYMYCNDCGDCLNAINNNSQQYIYMNKSILDNDTNCIYAPENITNKIFDCNGSTIDGSSTAIAGERLGLTIEKNNVTVRNCNFTDWYMALVYNKTGNSTIHNNFGQRNLVTIKIQYGENHLVQNNTINTGVSGGADIYIFDGANQTLIDNNTIINSGAASLYLINNTNSTIKNNHLKNNSGSGMGIIVVKNVTVYNNKIESIIANTGIQIQNATGITMTNNNLTNIGITGYGIQITSTENSTIQNNTLYNITAQSFYLEGLKYSHIDKNAITLTSYGLSLNELTRNNIISNNTITYATYGIQTNEPSKASNNTIIENLITKTTHSLQIPGSGTENKHYKNSLVDNGYELMQAYTHHPLVPQQNQVVRVNITVYEINGSVSLHNYTYNLSIVPTATVNLEAQNEHELLVNFTLKWKGIYSMKVNITDYLNNTAYRRYYYFVNANQTTNITRYYLRRNVTPEHGQVFPQGGMTDSGFLSFNVPATEKENISCQTWIQVSPNNKPNIYMPYFLERVMMNFTYALDSPATESLGMERYATYGSVTDSDLGTVTLPDTGALETKTYENMTSLNISMDYPESNYWLAIKMTTVGDREPRWYTDPENKSVFDFYYMTTDVLNITKTTNTNTSILSVLQGEQSDYYIYLDGKGTETLTLLVNSSISYDVFYDNINCQNTDACNTSQVGNEMNITIALGSEHDVHITPKVTSVFGGGGASSGGGGGTSSKICEAWQECKPDNTQTRTCKLSIYSPTNITETQTCTYVAPTEPKSETTSTKKTTEVTQTTQPEILPEETTPTTPITTKQKTKFPWWILLILIAIAITVWQASKRRKTKSRKA